MSEVRGAPLLEVEGLSIAIDGAGGVVHAVDDVSFSIHGGETFALLGESGCGKSMTALGLMRLLPDAGRIDGGSVRLGGRELLPLAEAEMRDVRGREIAMIFQEPSTSLNPVLTVGTQIGEVLARHQGLEAEAARQHALRLLDAVGIPDAARRLEEFPFQLSGGMKQRVMMAQALACAPRLLIADEPTTALDVTIQAQVLDLLAHVQRREQMAMLLITHDLGVVSQVAQQIGLMYAGTLIEIAERDEFFDHPRHPYARKLFAALPSAARRGVRLDTIEGSVPPLTRRFGGCRFAERCPEAWARCHDEIPQWTRIGERHTVRCHLYDGAASARTPPPRRESAASDPVSEAVAPGELLNVVGLKVHFPVRKGIFKRAVGYVKAVDGVSIGVERGRTLALVGESGCGKTTAGKAILRLVEPTAGTVLFDGAALHALSAAQLRPLRGSLQMIFQDPYGSLNPRMHVGDIITEGMSALKVADDPRARDEHVAELLRQVGLTPEMAARYPHEFSGGQRQRIAIARALAVRPKLLICDEPTSALDVSVQAQILNLLKGLQESLGLSYLFITHNIAVVDYLAHDVAVMYLGRIVEQGSAEEILRTPKHPYTAALLSAVPRIERERRGEVIMLKGELPSPLNPPSGCHFHPRCPKAMDVCRREFPGETTLTATHRVSCHLY